jgi:hypothetical protein
MDVLTCRSRVRWVVGLAGVAIVVTSCLVGDASVRESRFSHAVHGGQPGLTCSLCHGQPGAQMRMPGPQLCKPCHVELGIARERVDLDELFDESGRWRGERRARLPEEIRFDHASHAAADCASCHGDIAASDGVPAPALTKRDCMDCHAASGASEECATCHRSIDASWRPPSHGTGWAERHGLVVRACSERDVDRCELCHDAERSCNVCHREQLPRDHTNHWRVRGHGIAVRIDRTRCSTCHRSDFCDKCHEETQPRSHVGGWGAPQDRHCVSCHFPLRDTGCVTCHKATPSHAAATPLPQDHHAAMNCRMCHGAGVRLPHPDNGSVCTVCHR